MNNDNKMNKGEEVKKNMAKKAATAYAGPLGGKAVDLASKTKLGKAALQGNSDLINKNPGMPLGMPGLPKMGKKPKEEGLPKDGLEEGNNEKKPKLPGKGKNSKSPLSNLGKKGDEDQSEINAAMGSEASQAIFSFLKKHWKETAAVLGSVTLFLLLLLAIPIIIASIGGGVIEFFTKIGDTLIGFFEPDEQKQIEKYYAELDRVKNKIYSSKGICIDENLITATLTVDVDAQDYANDVEKEMDPDEETYTDEEGNELETVPADPQVDYKKMTKEVGILANMQMKNIIYAKSKTRTCPPADGEPIDEKVTDDNLDDMDFPGWWRDFKKAVDVNKHDKYVSNSPKLVARHDLTGFKKFFTKKVNEEKNYEYHIYVPTEKEHCHTGSNGAQTCSVSCDKNDIPKGEYPALSIGDLNTMEESVYYWNLVNSFIPNYYNEFLPKSDPERTEAIMRIAEDIYLLYKDLGPGEPCGNSGSHVCNTDEGPGYYKYDPEGKHTSESVKEFYDRLSTYAIDAMSKTGINASVILAVADFESGAGTNTLANNARNYFSIKAMNCTTESASNHRGETFLAGESGNTCKGNTNWSGAIYAMPNSDGSVWWRAYGSTEESVLDYAYMVSGQYSSNSRYAGCNASSDSLDQISCIINAGYLGSDPTANQNYIKQVMDKINTYNLTQYDIGQWNGTPASSLPNFNSVPTANKCYGTGGGASGDWANWKQCDSEWGGLKIGSSTICQVGCLMTSVAIQIARSGVPTNVDPFNPGTFMQYHKDHGGFSGNIFNWDVTDVAPSFHYYGKVPTNNEGAAKLIQSYANQENVYIILNLFHPGEHHVAVNYSDGDKIYMFDPGNYGDEVFSAFGSSLKISSISIYKVE